MSSRIGHTKAIGGRLTRLLACNEPVYNPVHGNPRELTGVSTQVFACFFQRKLSAGKRPQRFE